MENRKEMLFCYTEDTIKKILEILNQIEVKGITNISGLAAILNLMNTPAKSIENESGDEE